MGGLMRTLSLGQQTDLIFSKFSGVVTKAEDYILVQTRDNPEFHFGNYITFKYPPQVGDCQKWNELYRKLFPYYDDIKHMTFTWAENPSSLETIKEFEDAGFELDEGVVLTANNVNVPKKYNDIVIIKKILTDVDWASAYQNQIAHANHKYLDESYEPFKRQQMAQYRKMTEQNMGHWFGAFIQDKLVADLGVFHDGSVARYQSVGTHPDFRRQGICQTLVYETALIALKEFGVKNLVMEADVDYHAAKIYESVGFKPTGRNYALQWLKSNK